MENRIYITDQSGYVKAGLAGADEVILAWKGEYAEGDVIHMEFAEPGFYMIRVDDCVDDSLVYITETHLRYNVLFDEKKNIRATAMATMPRRMNMYSAWMAADTSCA